MDTRTTARRRLSPATVMASLALLVALGGTSIAAVGLPAGSVGNAQLKNDAVTSNKVKNGSLTNADLKRGQLPRGPGGPAGPAGPAGAAGAAGGAGSIGPTDAYMKSLDGPIVVPGSPTTLTTLTIPQPGKYVLWAKAWLTGGVTTVLCQISAGSDVDQVQRSLIVSAAFKFPLALNAFHEFSAAGTADFQCSSPGAGVTANAIKMIAVKVSNLTTG